jgi:hypothetical protein
MECGLRLVAGRVGDCAHLAGASDSAPFSDNTLAAEQIGLDVQVVEAVHVL